jgi:seryl-tRNA synthetase
METIQDRESDGSLRISLPHAIDGDLAAEIEKESAYVSRHVRRLRVTEELTAVEVELEGVVGSVQGEVAAKVRRYLAAMLTRVRRFQPTVYLENRRRSERPLARGVSDALATRGWLFEHGPGFVSLAGPARRLARALDATLAERYARWFGAEEAMYPACIRGDVLSRCGYLESHPNAISMVTHVVDDFDVIEEFRQANESGGAVRLPDPAVLAVPESCLNPAACFPCYQALEGIRLPTAGRTLSWLGRVFRHESRNTAGLDRLAEFNVRELVFLGREEHVREECSRLLVRLGELLDEWDLDCRIETASDPFFATVSAAKTFWQQSREVKLELRILVDPGEEESRRIACGSINQHDQFFGTRFQIDAGDDGWATTACAGLGIERLVLAVFSQHGLDPTRWPESLRRAVSE